MIQTKMFEPKVEFIYVESIIGSGYENDVAKLAIEDGVAHRAARKNMQIHSAIILKLDNVFSGFFTYQINHNVKEFCLLQSAMTLGKEDKEIYSMMVNEIIKQNIYDYIMIMTVSNNHKLENPNVFQALGFKVYMVTGDYSWMVYGELSDVRIKILAHIAPTNLWHSTSAYWLNIKKEWNEKIEKTGEIHGIPNPKYATREGCWQGENGMSNVVLSKNIIENGEVKHISNKSLNGNASVLDPVTCEIIIRFFMPKKGCRIYNPFGGGVQFGFIAGSLGYEYLASEIRQNQCDVNNILCSDFYNTKWIKSDSSKFKPKQEYDLIVSCPPYYKVEKYLDYNGEIPKGELNSIATYEEFRNTLFEGYKKAIEALNENCFFVIITGDSRDKNGAYYGSEAEHELFFKEQGLIIYNKIVYLESEFTRRAQSKKTLHQRKYPKSEQKIFTFYKGDLKNIKDHYSNLGRL